MKPQHEQGETLAEPTFSWWGALSGIFWFLVVWGCALMAFAAYFGAFEFETKAERLAFAGWMLALGAWNRGCRIEEQRDELRSRKP